MPQTQWTNVAPVMQKTMKCRRCTFIDQTNTLAECKHCGGKIKETGRNSPKPLLSGPKEFKINPLKRLIGFEIETDSVVDGLACTNVAKKYGAGMTSDGSVGSFEMQTTPANGDKLVRMIEDVSNTIRAAGAVAHANCGLHCHVDCRDLSHDEMRKVCIVYGKTEAALYSIIDPRRADGQYCKPVGGRGLVEMFSDPSTAKEDLISFVFGSAKNCRASSGKNPIGGNRYHGFNIYSWWMRGTIEFRMHHGTTKHEKMLPWGMLLGSMVDRAAKMTEQELDLFPVGLAGLLELAPTEAVSRWVKSRWEFFASKRKNKKATLLPVIPPAQLARDADTQDLE